ncbi:hypothetical protein K504DRAFT_54885 [Pleomassaria siparia CBS 279.74]|uniref:Uncharacterized protein n=1 Tax=Pleomassaria siparia CBS 279.74 TaxID=1314801 RepID=A0A6G1K4N7_9PLEO|nr:hypothetical protein K504DRAFT_54885 [Pleomassaria siparia CBS 279.74]
MHPADYVLFWPMMIAWPVLMFGRLHFETSAMLSIAVLFPSWMVVMSSYCCCWCCCCWCCCCCLLRSSSSSSSVDVWKAGLPTYRNNTPRHLSHIFTRHFKASASELSRSSSGGSTVSVFIYSTHPQTNGKYRIMYSQHWHTGVEAKKLIRERPISIWPMVPTFVPP